MRKPRAIPRVRRAWRTPDARWAEIEPLLPPRKPHPLGCHNPRVDDRRAMDAICFRLPTGCQWNALSGMNRFRGLLVRWDEKTENSLHRACAYITFARAGLRG